MIFIFTKNLKYHAFRQLYLHNSIFFLSQTKTKKNAMLWRGLFQLYLPKKKNCVLMHARNFAATIHTWSKEKKRLTRATVGKSWSDGFSCLIFVQTQNDIYIHIVLSIQITSVKRMTHIKCPNQMRNTKQNSIKSTKKEENISSFHSMQNEKQPQSQIIAGASQI